MGIESPVHLLFIAVVALMVLGPKRLPQLARALGKGIREFRGALEAGAQPAEHATPPSQAPASPTQPSEGERAAEVGEEQLDAPHPGRPGDAP
jgi:sec-independent protein translocase protein TatA